MSLTGNAFGKHTHVLELLGILFTTTNVWIGFSKELHGYHVVTDELLPVLCFVPSTLGVIRSRELR